MNFSAVYELTLEAAGLVSQRQFNQASAMLVFIMKMLHERRSDFANPYNSSTPGYLSVNDLELVPISKNYGIAVPEWDDEFFSLPIVFRVRSGVDSAKSLMTSEVAAACLSTCQFNLGLCHHLDAMRTGGNSSKSLKGACKFYWLAWACLNKFTGVDVSTENSISFLLMAVSINMAKCNYYLGEIEGSSEWLSTLRGLLMFCRIKEDSLTLVLRYFFLSASTINAGCIAAGAA